MYSLYNLVIYSQAYEPTFKPIHGILKASYNGVLLDIKIDGENMHCCVQTREQSFYFGNTFINPGMVSWGEILNDVQHRAMVTLVQVAMNELIYYQHAEGRKVC